LSDEEEVLEGKEKEKVKVKVKVNKVESIRWTKMFRGCQCGGCWRSMEDCEGASPLSRGRKRRGKFN